MFFLKKKKKITKNVDELRLLSFDRDSNIFSLAIKEEGTNFGFIQRGSSLKLQINHTTLVYNKKSYNIIFLTLYKEDFCFNTFLVINNLTDFNMFLDLLGSTNVRIYDKNKENYFDILKKQDTYIAFDLILTTNQREMYIDKIINHTSDQEKKSLSFLKKLKFKDIQNFSEKHTVREHHNKIFIGDSIIYTH